MATKVEIIYEAEATSLKATVNEVNKANDAVVASAQESSKEVATAYKNAGKSIAAAFSGGEVKKALADNNKAFDQLNSKGKTLTGQLRALKNQLSELEQAGKEGSAQFRQLTLDAARLEDQIGDTRARVQILASDTFKFDAAVGAVQGLAAGFEVAQGAAALFGSESEDLNKVLTKVTAAIAIANGVQQVAQLLLEESAIKTAVLTAAQRVYTFVTSGATIATKAWRAALVSTGVGALVVLLGSLISSLMDTTDATDDAAESSRNYQKAIDDLNKTVQQSGVKAANAQIELLQKQGKITEEQAKRLTAYNDLQIALSAAATSAKEKEAEALKRFEEQKANDVKMFGKVTQTTQKQLSDELKAIEIERANNEKELRARQQIELINIEDEANQKRKDAAEKQSEERKKIAKAEKEAFIALLNETAKLQLDFDKEQAKVRKDSETKLQISLTDLADTSLQTQLDDRINFLKKLEIEEGSSLDRRIQLIELDGKKQIADAEGNANLIALINAETQQKIREEQKKTAQEQLDNLLEIAQATADILGQIIELQGIQSQKRIDGITAASEADRLAIEKSTASEREKQSKLEALRIRTEQKVAAEKRRQAVAEKAAAIFEATINTAVAVAKAATPPLKAIALASGLAQIAIIAATPIPKFKKGGPVGGRSHEAGGTLIEAEKGEYVVNKASVSQHRKALDAMNTSSAAFKKYIDERYVRPAIAGYALNNRDRKIEVKASLSSKSMEKELKGLRKDLRNKNTVVNINGFDSRYAWHQN